LEAQQLAADAMTWKQHPNNPLRVAAE